MQIILVCRSFAKFGIGKTGVNTYQMADLAIFSSDFPQPL